MKLGAAWKSLRQAKTGVAVKGPSSLKEKVFSFLASRKDDYRAPGYHPSSMYKLCPRKAVLDELFPVDPEVFTPGLLMTFDIGHAMHDWWQNKYLGPMGVLVGKWQCYNCREKIGSDTDWKPRPTECESCKSDKGFGYSEIGLKDEALNIVGHCDGVLLIDGEYCLFELKTINDYGYQTLLGPKSSHRYQVTIYMKLLGIKKAVIVYINKGKTGQLKEFAIDFDDTMWEDVCFRIKLNEDTKKEMEDNGPSLDLVDRTPRICISDSCEMARWCPQKASCFGREAKVAYKP